MTWMIWGTGVTRILGNLHDLHKCLNISQYDSQCSLSQTGLREQMQDKNLKKTATFDSFQTLLSCRCSLNQSP
jgi:hypothetical protein